MTPQFPKNSNTNTKPTTPLSKNPRKALLKKFLSKRNEPTLDEQRPVPTLHSQKNNNTIYNVGSIETN